MMVTIAIKIQNQKRPMIKNADFVCDKTAPRSNVHHCRSL